MAKNRKTRKRPLHLELLEDRTLPSVSSLQQLLASGIIGPAPSNPQAQDLSNYSSAFNRDGSLNPKALPANAVAINWHGENRYQAAGEWIARLNLPLPTTATGSDMLQAASTELTFLGGRAGSNALLKSIQVTKYLGGNDTFLLQAPTSVTFDQINAALIQMPGFQYVEPDFIVHSTDTFPNDPLFPQMYDLHNTGQNGGTPNADISAPEAWDISTGSRNIVVGVIDTGITYDHPDLYQNVWINDAEIPASRLANLVDTNGDGVIDFVDLNNPVNQGPFKITDVNGDGVIDASDILAPMQKDSGGNDTGMGGWADGISEDGDTAHVDDLVGWNFVSNTNNPLDDFGHGTHVSGTIGAMTNNSTGIAGINWNVQITGLKFLDSSGSGTTDGAIAAVNYAESLKHRGVNIKETNNSWGGGGFSQGLKDAIENNGNPDMLFIAAAGNSSNNNDANPFYPATYDSPNIISVAATDNRDNLASFSDFGATTVDLGAPGVNTLSTLPKTGPLSDPSGYGFLSGTSMATPHVTGVAALAWSIAPNADFQQIKDAILNGVDPDPSLAGITVTGGRLDAFKTLQNLGMFVTGTTPGAGSFVSTPPTDFVVQFSSAYDPASVDASDLTVNGIAANSVTLTDASTLTFHYTSSPVKAEGPQTMAMAAGAVDRLSDGQAVRAFSSSFFFDTQRLAVVSTSPAPGSGLNLPQDLIVNFNEAFDPTTVGTGNLILSEGTVTAAKILSPTSIAYTISGNGVPDGSPINVTLAAGALLDTDGNPNSAFAAGYTANVLLSAYPTPLSPKQPGGSLIYDPSVSATIGFVGDTDSFTVPLDAGQTATVVVKPDANLQAVIELFDPNGNIIGTATASGPGQYAVLQAVPISVAGTYTITILGANNTTGAFTAQLFLNAAVSNEQYLGKGNDTPGTAQNIDGSFIDLGNGISRGAVLGNIKGFVTAGDAFVSERSATGVVIVDPSGRIIGKFNDPAFTGNTVNDLELGPDGSVYVAIDTSFGGGVGEILHFDTAGDLLNTITPPADGPFGFFYPFGFAVASDGTLWLTQPNNGNIIHIDTSGNVLQTFSGLGNPEMLAIRSDGMIFFSNTAFGEVDELNPNNGSVSFFTFTGTPLGVRFTADGSLLVSDIFNGAERFDTNGNLTEFLPDFGAFGAQEDLSHNVLVANFFNNTLDKFDPNGNFVSSTPLLGPGVAVSVAGVDGPTPPPGDNTDYYSFSLSAGQIATIALTDTAGGQADLTITDANGNPVALARVVNTNINQVVSSLKAPSTGLYYIRVTGNGVQYSLVVTEGADFSTQDNSSKDKAQTLFPSSNGTWAALGQINAPAGLFGIDWQNPGPQLIHVIDQQTGAFLSTITAPSTPLTNPFGFNMALDGTNLWFNDGAFFGTNTIYKLNPSTGAVLDSFTAPTPFQLTGLAWLNGFLYGTDGFAVYQIDPNSHGLVSTFFPGLDGVVTGLAGDPDRGVLWAVSQFHTIFEIDPVAQTVINTAPDGLSLNEQDLGYQNGELYVSETNGPGANDIAVFDANTLTMTRDLPVNTPIFISGLGADGIPTASASYFKVSVNAGDNLVIDTTTPFGEPQFPNQPNNGLQPILELFDPNGNLVATAQGNAPDGKNDVLNYTALTSGTFFVKVSGANKSAGEFTVAVKGATGALPAFTVTGTDPAAGKHVRPITTVTVDFSDSVLISSLSDSDFTINGENATGFTVVNDHEVIFDLPTDLPKGNDLPFTINIQNVQDIHGDTVVPFSEVIFIDSVPPSVIGTSIEQGKILPTGNLTYVVTFSEEIDTSNFSASSFDLHGIYRNVDYAPASFSFDATGTVLTITYNALPDDGYQMTLFSSGITDITGFHLDGEPHSPRPPSVPSGNGVEGGDFFVDFSLDNHDPSPFPTPFQAINPLGSLVYQSSTTQVVSPGGETDSYTVALDPNQTLTLDLMPDSNLQATVSFYAPNGSLIATGTASAVGSELVLQTEPVLTEGTYKIVVTGANGTPGLYTLTATLNAAVENEDHGGSSNDSIGSAQSLESSFLNLGSGQRGAALGVVGSDPADYYSFQLGKGQAATIAVTSSDGSGTVELFDASGNAVAFGAAGAANVNQTIANFVARAKGTYYVAVTGNAGSSYNLDVTRGLAFDTETNDSTAQDITPTALGLTPGGVLGSIDTPSDVDLYSLNIGGDVKLQLSFAVPDSGPGQFVNNLQPLMELIDPHGRVVSGPSKSITYFIPGGFEGIYTVKVFGANGTSGEYVLNAQNVNGKLLPFVVTGTNPPAGALVQPPPSITVDFNHTIYLPSLQAADLVATDITDPSQGSVAASSFVVDNDHEVTFFFSHLFHGNRQDTRFSITAGAIQDVSGAGLQKFSEDITTDDVPPTVVSATIHEGAVLPTGTLTYVVTFSEPMNTGLVNLSSFDLHGIYRNVDYTPTSFSFDPTGTILTFTYANLPDDGYTDTLFASSFQDLVGHTLSPGDYVVDFSLDQGTVPFPTPLNPVGAPGGLVYAGSTTNVYSHVGDGDAFTLTVDRGQTITVLVQSSTAQAVIWLYDSNGHLVATTQALAPGADAVLQTAPTNSGMTATYTIVVGGMGGAFGLENTQVYLNTALQSEQHGGTSDNSPSQAQDLSSSFITLGNGASRGAVIGQIPTSIAAGTVFVAERGSPGILIMDPNGNIIGSFNDPSLSQGTISDVELGPDSTVYVSEDLSFGGGVGVILHFDMKGDLLNTITPPNDSPFGFFYPFGFAVAADGTLWLTQPNNGNIIHIDPSGNVLATFSGLGNPEMLAIRSDGMIFFSNTGFGEIDELNPNNGSVTFFASSFVPLGVRFAPDGSLLVGDIFNGVERFDTNGNLTEFLPDFGTFGAQEDLSHNVLIANFFFNSVDKFDPNGNFVNFTPTPGSPTAVAVVGVDAPTPPPPDATDFYSFSLAKNQSVTVTLNDLTPGSADVALVDANNNVLASGTVVNNGEINEELTFVAPTAGTYYIRVTGNGETYSLVVTKGAAFDTEANDSGSQAQDISKTGGALGSIATSGDADYYSVTLGAGATLNLSTTTPGGGVGAFVNTLSPHISVYDANGNLVASGVKLADGRNESLAFKSAKGGTYSIRVTGDAGSTGEYFLSKAVARAGIDGRVFDDLNGDGVEQASEPGLNGWTIKLFDSHGHLVATTQSQAVDLNGDGVAGDQANENGLYAFAGLAPGKYTIQEVSQSGWVQTFPANGAPQSVTLKAGQVKTGVDFGDFQQVALSGTVFNDLNDDRVQESGEPGLSGVTILLDGVAAAVTDGMGHYTITGVGPGTHTISEVVPSAYLQTSPKGNTFTVTTSSGVNMGGENFSNVIPNPTVDNGQKGYSETGGGWSTINGGWNGTSRVHAATSSGSVTAKWNASVSGDVPTGFYEVFVSFVTDPGRSKQASYTISDGITSTVVTVDQTQTPNDGFYQGMFWKSLGFFQTKSGILTVTLKADSSGSVSADGVLFVFAGKTKPAPALVPGGGNPAAAFAISPSTGHSSNFVNQVLSTLLTAPSQPANSSNGTSHSSVQPAAASHTTDGYLAALSANRTSASSGHDYYFSHLFQGHAGQDLEELIDILAKEESFTRSRA
jgi:subtilisin family serine protease